MFVTSRPDGRQLWVNFAYPDNDRVQVIGSETHVFCMIHGRQQDQVEAQVQALLQAQLLSDLPHPLLFSSDGALILYDSNTLAEIKRIPMNKPSGKYNVGNKIEFVEGTSH